MLFVAVLCVLLGIGLIVLCFVLPSGSMDNENDKSHDSDKVRVGQYGSIISDVSNSLYSQFDVSESGNYGETDLDPLLILANFENPLPDDFEVGDLEQVQGNYYLDSRAAEYAKKMISDAATSGIVLQVCSAYRAKDLQQRLFTNKYNEYIQNGLSESAAYAKTSTIIAIPGTSEHQTGLCMDIVTPSYQVLDSGYADTDAAKWLYENAHNYGFILRYPEDKQDITMIIFEPWHYRFVGVENAKLIKESGLCLEEYIETLK